MLGIIFPKKSFRSDNIRKNKAMKDFMERPEFKEVLNSRREREEFFEKLQEHGSEHGLTRRDMKEMFHDLKHDHGDHLSDKEARKLSNAVIDKRTDKYIKPKGGNEPSSPEVKKGWF